MTDSQTSESEYEYESEYESEYEYESEGENVDETPFECESESKGEYESESQNIDESQFELNRKCCSYRTLKLSAYAAFILFLSAMFLSIGPSIIESAKADSNNVEKSPRLNCIITHITVVTERNGFAYINFVYGSKNISGSDTFEYNAYSRRYNNIAEFKATIEEEYKIDSVHKCYDARDINGLVYVFTPEYYGTSKYIIGISVTVATSFMVCGFYIMIIKALIEMD